MDVKINESEIDVPAGIATWGDLLDWIETGYLADGHCITHVYLDGNKACNYRDNLICGQDLAAVRNVTVHSGDFDRVIHESWGELDQELKNAFESCGAIIRLLENRKEEEAYNQLAQLLDSIRIFFTIFSEDLGWTEPAEAEISSKEFSALLESALTQLIKAQENRYWLSICDVLEYEIAPLLESWQKLVGRTRVDIN